MATTIAIPGTGKTLGGEEVFVIAEIGKNFIETEDERPVEEYLANAKALIDAAAEAGADAVKFQTHVLEDEFMPGLDVVSPHFKGSDRYRWIKRNEEATPDHFWQEVKRHARARGILFFSTPMSRKAAEKLEALAVPLWKIGSGDVEDHVTLDFIASTGKPLIISTGMVSLSELDEVVGYIRSKHIPLVVLYCVSQYPCPPEYFNLASIELFKEKYPDVVIGFSDHSVDSHDVDLAAIKLGARVLEKHFSFSRDKWGSDHKASITPAEMKAMIDAIRGRAYEQIDTGSWYGNKTRELEGANNQFRPYFNKALVAGTDIAAGTTITKDMVFAMRPKMYIDGLPANQFEAVVGKRAAKDLKKYDPIAINAVV
jgi:N,N'-diacetyllegionaminate synthase